MIISAKLLDDRGHSTPEEQLLPCSGSDFAVAAYRTHTEAESAMKAMPRADCDIKKRSIVGNDDPSEKDTVGFLNSGGGSKVLGPLTGAPVVTGAKPQWRERQNSQRLFLLEDSTMPFALKPFVLATLLASGTLASVQTAPTSAAPAAVQAPSASKIPNDWIVYDDTNFTPVVDEVSRHLNAARKAFDANDNKKAAAEMRAVAAALKKQAALSSEQDQALVREDKAILAADRKDAREVAERMHAIARQVRFAAAAIDSGEIKTKADMDKVIDKAARADLDRRWLITDVTTWYPLSEQQQRHFTAAIADYTKKDYKAAATDIRKAASYLRLETGRASGTAKQGLERSIAQLGTLAAAVEKGTVKDERTLSEAFAQANYALALEHRAKAAESWTRKEYNKTGYELKAAAHGLESAAGWVGQEMASTTTAVVADTRTLGDKLIAGMTSTRDEVARAIELLGRGINALGRKIASAHKNTPGAGSG